ncbi:hypothetical protein [Parvibacter caecicola]|uniref:hypothetical protein n=1 Tax=Parvibacter caecicola TaxID=747645 RepID=UPI0027318D48|nr:hypothetical protein [Parvibacter caecicola]
MMLRENATWENSSEASNAAMRERARLALREAELEERSGAAAISGEESNARIAELLQGMGAY